jgi:very-short-patch-repair endonuclease
MTTNDPTDQAKARASRLRHTPTDAEKRLWRRLRNLQIKGSHFRRQVPIGPYVADFACMAARLIIELDGWRHGNQKNQQHDAIRTAWLQEEGYRVLRIWNNEIDRNIYAVMEGIYAELYGGMNAEAFPLKHSRRRRTRSTTAPPRRALRADPPPAGEGKE